MKNQVYEKQSTTATNIFLYNLQQSIILIISVLYYWDLSATIGLNILGQRMKFWSQVLKTRVHETVFYAFHSLSIYHNDINIEWMCLVMGLQYKMIIMESNIKTLWFYKMLQDSIIHLCDNKIMPSQVHQQFSNHKNQM